MKLDGPPQNLEQMIGDSTVPYCWHRHELMENKVVTGSDHSHEKHQIIGVEHGIATLITKRGRLLVPPGSGIWIPANMVHSAIYHGQTVTLNLYLENSLLRQPAPQDLAFIPFSRLLHLLFERIVALPTSAISDASSKNLMAVLLDEIKFADERVIRVPWPQDPRLQKVCAFLDQNPADEREFDDVARLAAVSPRTLSRLFIKELGISYSEWCSLLRISKAMQMLARNVSVTEAALSCGFQSLSSFNRRFKTLCGKTPSNFLKATG